MIEEKIVCNNLMNSKDNNELFKKLHEKLLHYKYEKSITKADFFQNSSLDKENERIICFIDSIHNAYKQFINDNTKFFYYFTTNLVVLFMHVFNHQKNESQIITLLSGKNKNLCKLLEKESILNNNKPRIFYSRNTLHNFTQT